jgi:hypothetical protein
MRLAQGTRETVTTGSGESGADEIDHGAGGR